MSKKRHILASYVRKITSSSDKNDIIVMEKTKTPDVISTNDNGVVREETFYSYLIYSNKENNLIGSIYLTENQAYSLNQLMKRRFNKENPDIAFIRS